MLFLFLFSAFALFTLLIALPGKKYEWVAVCGGVCAVVTLVLLFFSLVGLIISYLDHASDLGTLRNAASIIEVQQSRCDRLRAFLDSAHVTTGSAITVNSDTPYKEVVTQLAVAEAEFAKTRAEVVNARTSIEKRRAGPYSFLVSWCGAN